MKKYAVIVKNIDQLESLYSDMEHSGTGNSNCCPEGRSICSCRKPSSRVTYYQLTEQEAELLKQDPRVESVELSIEEQNIIPKLIYEQKGIFSKLPSSNNHKNWGLLYLSNNGNYIPFWGGVGTGTNHIEATIDFDNNSLGEGVDIVVVDGGVDFNHPEFALNADGTGGSRFVQYDWFQHDVTVKGTPQTTTYNYIPNANKSHGTHVAGIAAGNTQGWAKKANIYNINIFDDQISSVFIFDYIKAFHNGKNGTRPTVVNCSFQYEIGGTFNFGDCVFRIMSRGPVHMPDLIETVPFDKNNPYIFKEITNVHYQGTDYNERFVQYLPTTFPSTIPNYPPFEPRCERATYSDGIFADGRECCEEITDINCAPKGGGFCQCQLSIDGVNNTICLQDVGFEMCGSTNCREKFSSEFTYDSIDYFHNIGWPVYLSQIDADVADAISAGVIVIAAAGNDSRYIADQNDINYNNRIDAHESSSLYYMRRASPATNASLVVGALRNQRITTPRYSPVQKSEIANFSNKGTGVDIWAPGMNIMSADFGSVNNISTFEDPRNSAFTIGIKSGTSMASPQVAGILACHLSLDNTINSSNVKTYLLNNSRQNEIRLGYGKPRPIGQGPHFGALDPLSSDSREVLNSYATAYGGIVPAPLSINFINQQFVYAGQNGIFSPNFVLDNITNKQKIRRIYTFSGPNNSNILRWSPDDAFSQFSSLEPNKLYWVESLASSFENNIIENVIVNTVSDSPNIIRINQFFRYSLQDDYPLNNLDLSVKEKIRRIYTFSGPNNSNILRWSPDDDFSQFAVLQPNRVYWVESLASNFASYVLL